jgi:hypothetical protein
MALLDTIHHYTEEKMNPKKTDCGMSTLHFGYGLVFKQIF